MITKTRIDHISLKDGKLVYDNKTDEAISLLIDDQKIKSQALLSHSTPVKLLSHELRFSGISQAKYLSHSNKWSKVQGEISIPAYHNIVIELTHKDNTVTILYTNKPFTSVLRLRSGEFSFTIIHDAPFVHPTWDYSKGMRMSSATPEFKKGTRFEAAINILRPAKQFKPVYRSYYPDGAKACFMLTDHCDFDTTKKLDVFLNGNENEKNGWLNKGLKISKGVFRYSPAEAEPRKSDDLQVGDYKNLVDVLYKDGSEICPHALKHSGQLTSEQFHTGVKDLYNLYQPQTWIDHGSYLQYCYSQNGHRNKDYLLLDTLKGNAYNNLWSFYDTNLDPSFSLDFFSDKKYNKLNAIRIILSHFARLNILYGLHYVRSFFHKNLAKSTVVDFLNYSFACSKELFVTLAKNKKKVFSATRHYISRLFKFGSFRTKAVEHFTHDELNSFCPPLFTEQYQSVNNYTGGLFFFNTIETTHIKDIYTTKLLNKLISGYGLHIGHTYILNSLPYINGIFERSKTDTILSKEWIGFTETLSSKIKTKEIWNPNMGEFVDRFKLILNVDVNYTDEGLFLVNKNDVEVRDFTLFDINHKKLILSLDPGSQVHVSHTQFN